MAYFEEHHEGSNRTAWILIISFVVFIISYCMVMMIIIKSPPREWDFQVLPDAPSQSIYSTKDYKEQIFPPEQIERLPEASVPNDTSAKSKYPVNSSEDSVK